MTEVISNPFSTTKAVFLSDEEINAYWVDPGSDGGFFALARPASPMPMFILGGKGSGKTHLMRYFSHRLQAIRWRGEVQEGISRDGYIGIYLKSSGLNASRFQGKGQPEDVWQGVFAYYMELSLVRLVIQTIEELFGNEEEFKSNELELCEQIRGLFDSFSPIEGSSLKELQKSISSFQREVDVATNNCALRRELDLEIRATPGSLVFGLPKVCAVVLPSLRSVLFLYLIDELENLSESQQRHVQTLIREKEPPSSFKIGARRYGLRTLETYSAGEENREGSEFELIYLDDWLRDRRRFDEFARRMVLRRLAGVRARKVSLPEDTPHLSAMDDWFESSKSSSFGEEETGFVFESQKRSTLEKLRRQLQEGLEKGLGPGLASSRDVDSVVDLLRVQEYPLLEKANVFRLYRCWAGGKNLVKAAAGIAEECRGYLKGEAKTSYVSMMRHFRADFLAQLRREYDQPQRYEGFSTFVDMSLGSPKNLLMLLKNIFDWAIFNGERPFEGEPISRKAQFSGVAKTVEWFYGDARIPGADGKLVQDAINKLGNFLRNFRYSDKPSECSCTAFSVNLEATSATTQQILYLAVQWSLLLDVGTQRDRNSSRIDKKYQINPMLAPRWDLAIYRRGALALRPQEVDAIFDPSPPASGIKLLEKRIWRLMAPNFGRRNASQESLFKTV